MMKTSLIRVSTLMMFFTFGLTGCASLFNKAAEKVGIKATTPEGNGIERFSENQNNLNPSNRNFKRMTRSRIEEESELNSQAGSMWLMEGQGAYLFAQNKARREGDLLNVKMEGSAQKQIDTKVSVIKKLLKQLEEEDLKALAPAAGQGLAAAGGADAKRAPASEAKPEEKEQPVELEPVPTRIIERTADGNYRVKGQQPFMIGKREYKVIVTGLVRPEDFNDEGIASGKLMDPQYDVVSIRKKEKATL